MPRQPFELDTEHLGRDLFGRPVLIGILCWLTLGVSSCTRISFVRLKDFNYRNEFFSESIHNDGWLFGLIIGILAGVLWGILNIIGRDSLKPVVTLTTLAVLAFIFIRLPISGRWGNHGYEVSQKAFLSVQNSRATSLQFYKTESYETDLAKKERVYASRFKHAKQRTYIRWELQMQYEQTPVRLPFTVDVLLKRYDGRNWVEVGWAHPKLVADESSRELAFTGGWGLVEKGKFEADFWIAGKGLASAGFEIY